MIKILKQNIKYFLFFIVAVSVIQVYAQKREVKFKHLTTKDGLSLNSIHSFFQDQDGFIWISTRDGLNKYDAVNFTVYRNSSSDSTSIGGNDINKVIQDSKGNIWVAVHQGGLNKYNPKQDNFTVYKHNPDDPTSICNDIVNTIVEDTIINVLWIATSDGLSKFDLETQEFDNYRIPEDKNGGDNWIADILIADKFSLWIATRKGGLAKFDKKRGFFSKYYKHDDLDPNSISDNGLYKLYRDAKNQIWIGTLTSGLDLFNPKNKKFSHYKSDPLNPNSISDNTVFAIKEDTKGRLWVGTEHGGLNLFDRNTQNFTHFLHDADNDYSLSQNSVQGIDLDNEGNLWISTYAGGLNILPKSPSAFKHYETSSSDSTSISNNNVLGMLLDSKGRFWVATDGGGLNMSPNNDGKFIHFKYNPTNPNSIGSNAVLEVYEDKSRTIWVGTYGGGLARYREATNDFEVYKNNSNIKYSVGGNSIGSFLEDSKGRFWVGTWLNGLDLFDRDFETFSHFKHVPRDPESFVGYHINGMYEDDKGLIWIGTHRGMSILDPETGKFKNFIHEEGDTNSISHSTVTSIIQDDQKNYWIGTWGGGLNHYDPSTGKFKSFKKKDGLPNNVIYEILKDKFGNLWLSTNKGLSRFNPITKKFKNYDSNDGLLGDQFFYGSSFKDSTGRLYFGSTEGVNIFKPEDIHDNPLKPKVVFTNFRIFNQPIKIGSSELPEHINEVDTISLKWKQSVFTIAFAALNFNQPDENQYAYRMIGFEDAYNYVGNKHTATYTNLDPGTYSFHVKASNNDGLWNEEGRTLVIHILPPFWKTWWFQTLVIVLFVSLIFYLIRRRINTIKERNEELERLVQERTTEVVRQKEEIETQANQLILKNKQITDSINYAQTIQNAILPNTELFRETFEEFFIIYRQKDIVSGDFYWLTENEVNGRKYCYVAAVDCTGHGVPGAFMSMIGSRMLNLIVNEQYIHEPKNILEKLHEEIVSALNQDQGLNNDGMDLGIVRIEYLPNDKREIVYSGAKRPLYYTIPSEGVHVIKGDRRSIGGNSSTKKPFTDNTVVLSKGDIIYLSTDGLIDQNNIERKKFGSKKLVELLNELRLKSLPEQHHALETELDEYQRKTEQRDDITFLGIRM